MNVFPADFDLDQLKGIILESISFGAWKISFHFSQGWVIGVEDDLSIDENLRSFLPEVLPALFNFINQIVRKITRIDASSIALEFENDRVLFVYGATEEYECYQIERNGKVLVVV